MCSQLHNRRPRTPHIQDLYIRPIRVERRHIVIIRGIERDPQKRTCRRPRARVRRRRHRRVLWWWGFVEDGGVFEGAEVEGAEGTIGTYGDEDVGAAWKPGDVVDFAVVRYELGERLGGVDVPDGTGRID